MVFSPIRKLANGLIKKYRKYKAPFTNQANGA